MKKDNISNPQKTLSSLPIYWAISVAAFSLGAAKSATSDEILLPGLLHFIGILASGKVIFNSIELGKYTERFKQKQR